MTENAGQDDKLLTEAGYSLTEKSQLMTYLGESKVFFHVRREDGRQAGKRESRDRVSHRISVYVNDGIDMQDWAYDTLMHKNDHSQQFGKII